ncbi:glycosyltransferase [Acidianus sp. HS-5]|uniref:glycosyltransferase family 4 protein n=1 Tax=Acidianus sp. HS-5 TaxID=2886040 RepID=UPI001F4191CE|nr:glycosyltransferase [Acidianus sp. HS-5]BDC18528.1 hypothetical protein HS5_14180 [Acidianus sp. HS-5]
MKILRIADPSLNVGGAEKRAFNVLKYLSKIDDVVLIPPLESIINHCKDDFEELKLLEKEGVKIPENVRSFQEKCEELRLSKNPLLSVKQEISYYSNFLEDVKDVDVIFVDHIKYNLVGSAVFLKKQISSPLILLQQSSSLKEIGSLLWNIRNRGFVLESFLHPLAEVYVRRLWRSYSTYIDLVLGVSYSAIKELFSSGYVEKPIKSKVLRPANAVELKEKVDVGKENNLAIYFSRLEPEKGIRDIQKIWKEVSRELPNANLIIAGKFFSEKIKKEFFKNINGNAKYLGFISSPELLSMLGKSKVFIYPTHGDAFPLSVLESLMEGTPVVAYGIPAISEAFGNLPAVKVVREGDIVGMARETVNVLKMENEEIKQLFDDESVKKFLELHSSWEKVALAEHKAIKEFLEEDSK